MTDDRRVRRGHSDSAERLRAERRAAIRREIAFREKNPPLSARGKVRNLVAIEQLREQLKTT